MLKNESTASFRWPIAAAVGLVAALLVVVTGGPNPAAAASVYGYDDALNVYDHVLNLAPDAAEAAIPDGPAAQ